MSNYVFPDLIGLDIAVERSAEYDTTVHTTVSGKEYRTSWASTPIYRYKLKWNVLRETVAAPAPNQALNEVSVLLSFLDTHKGSFDSFLFVDPYSGSQVRVRFVKDSLEIKRIGDKYWECKLELISVK